MNWLDWLLIGLLALGAGLALFALLRKKRGGCSCGCGSCPHAGQCPSAKRTEQTDKGESQ